MDEGLSYANGGTSSACVHRLKTYLCSSNNPCVVRTTAEKIGRRHREEVGVEEDLE
jgi:hypothetical protein